MKKQYYIKVQGKSCDWSIPIVAKPQHVEDWRNDGLEIMELINSIPAWWIEWSLPIGLYCFFQDVFNFKNPFRKK